MSGDLLLINGRIRTMDTGNPVVSAVAIRMGRIVYAGDHWVGRVHRVDAAIDE